MVGVAVNVILSPEHMVSPTLDAIDTDGVALVTIVKVIVLEVAVAGDTQFALEVITAYTASPLASVVVVYVEEVAPVMMPLFLYH